MSLLAILTIFSGLFIGWNIGANDAANSMGTAVGARVRSLKEAVILVSVFGFLGAVLFGGRVIKTVGKGIVPLSELDPALATRIALAAVLAGGLWVLLATFLRLPVSTSHSAVGAVAGAGLSAENVPILWGKFGDVFLAWILTPLGAAAISFVLYQLLRVILSVAQPKSDAVFRWLLTLSGIYMAFSWGANDVANATGVIVGAGLLTPFWASVIGGLAIAVGIMTMGHRVIETIGSRITHLVPAMAFVAEIASAVNVQVYTVLGMPVSTTHSIVGAVFGIGLVQGRAAIDPKVAREILLAWAATPLAAGLVAYVLFQLMRLV